MIWRFWQLLILTTVTFDYWYCQQTGTLKTDTFDNCRFSQLVLLTTVALDNLSFRQPGTFKNWHFCELVLLTSQLVNLTLATASNCHFWQSIYFCKLLLLKTVIFGNCHWQPNCNFWQLSLLTTNTFYNPAGTFENWHYWQLTTVSLLSLLTSDAFDNYQC